MFRRSLTAKILIAVGVTVALIIAIYTYFVIRVQSAWWHERTTAANLISATVVNDYLEAVMLSDRHDEVSGFLGRLKSTGEITRGRIVDPAGRVAFSTESQEVNRVVMDMPSELFVAGHVLHGERADGNQPVSIAFSPVRASESCLRCHHSKQTYLGAIVLERSLAPVEANVASNRNLLILYGALIFLLVGAVLWLLIVRLVTQPVGNLLDDMQQVQSGNLATRAAPQSDDQIGQLTSGFNSMVASLETARKELHESHEKQIQQAGKLASIGELASGIAHEIRNPLAGIAGAVDVLAENQAGQGEYSEIVSEIRQQIQRLNQTLRGLLDFAKQSEPQMDRCEVRDLLKPMLGLVRIDAQKQKVRIEDELPADLPALYADPQQLQQALLNIFLNAIQAMPEGGTLRLGGAAVPGAERVQLTIADTGAGIPADVLPKIFSPFFTTKHRGTGLGLAITRTIIEKHHGVIRIESTPGQGTTVTLELVAYREEHNHAQN